MSFFRIPKDWKTAFLRRAGFRVGAKGICLCADLFERSQKGSTGRMLDNPHIGVRVVLRLGTVPFSPGIEEKPKGNPTHFGSPNPFCDTYRPSTVFFFTALPLQEEVKPTLTGS